MSAKTMEIRPKFWQTLNCLLCFFFALAMSTQVVLNNSFTYTNHAKGLTFAEAAQRETEGHWAGSMEESSSSGPESQD